MAPLEEPYADWYEDRRVVNSAFKEAAAMEDMFEQENEARRNRATKRIRDMDLEEEKYSLEEQDIRQA